MAIMNSPIVFRPARRRGLTLHAVAALLSAAGSAAAFWLAFLQEEGGLTFLLLLFTALLLLAPLPFILYRGYSLYRASYALERAGLRIRWGLHAEDIPLPEIEWVRPAAELGFHLPLPAFVWDGAILGTRSVEGLGPVEFFAADLESMLLIATPQRVYAISPEEPAVFLRTYQRTAELGSPAPLVSYHAAPAAFLRLVWGAPAARGMLLGGLGLVVMLFTFTSLVVSGRAAVSLGYDVNGQPMSPGPAERLFLLPILGAMTYVFDLIAGLYFFRKAESRPAAYLVWIGGMVTSVFLLAAAILQALSS